MTTLSLLKNIKEIADLKVKVLPLPQEKEVHKDMDWAREEYLKWSKQFAITNPKMDGMLLIFVGIMGNNCQTKERLLNVLKAMENTFYIDVYLLPERKDRSASKAEELIENLITALKTGECDEKFVPGKRMIESLRPMKGELTSDQWQVVEKHLEMAFRAHLDIHCNYWLRDQFIPLDDYYYKRIRESFWPFMIFLSEYILDFTIPNKVRSHHLFEELARALAEFGLAVDDYFLAKIKIMNTDITNRVVCLLNEKRCTLQEAVDNQYEYTMGLHDTCSDLKDRINGNPELASDKLSAWMDTAFKTIYSTLTVVEKAMGIHIDDDQTLRSDQWDRVYKELESSSTKLVDPWEIA